MITSQWLQCPLLRCNQVMNHCCQNQKMKMFGCLIKVVIVKKDTFNTIRILYK